MSICYLLEQQSSYLIIYRDITFSTSSRRRNPINLFYNPLTHQVNPILSPQVMLIVTLPVIVPTKVPMNQLLKTKATLKIIPLIDRESITFVFCAISISPQGVI